VVDDGLFPTRGMRWSVDVAERRVVDSLDLSAVVDLDGQPVDSE
jgi:hypothetical protein